MPLILIAAFLVGGVLFLWLVQAASLKWAGDAQIWVPPFRHHNESGVVRYGMKLAVQVVLAGILFGLPLALGVNPIEFHGSWMSNPPWHPILLSLALTVGIFAAYQMLNVQAGWMNVAPKYGTAKTVKKMIRGCLTPVPLAIMEEAVFRAVILGMLLNAMPDNSTGISLAVFLSALIFCSVHFIRPLKNTILPALGLFALGIVLGIAYVLSGRNCWVPITIHAAGVWVIQLLRPFVTYRAPPWLIGYPSYPICGVVGLACMAVLSIILVVVGVMA